VTRGGGLSEPRAGKPYNSDMKLNFTKMQGAGNDFVVIDATSGPFTLDTEQIRRVADRHFGVGADQMLVVEKPTIAGVDFRYRIFNNDGGEVEHCGNGARCFVKFVRDRGLTTERTVRVVADTETAPVGTDGPLIERHARFPQRVNAGFMQVIGRNEINLRVYERGAGETLACGTGACAAVVAGIRRGLLDSPVQVHTHGGDLTIAWDGGEVRMAGPAATVFEGSIEV